MLRVFLLVVAILNLLPELAAAQQATLADCVDVIQGDSVAMFFTTKYVLTPKACAAIRRHTRISAQGDFQGEVRDFQVDNNKLKSRLVYVGGQRNGLYEQYYVSGQRSIQGQFTNGTPSGTWHYWYPSGKPWQILEWTGSDPALRIMAYWDAAGVQRVANGNGEWHDVMPGVNRRYGGPVVDGYAHGTWESHDAYSTKLYTTEEYSRGKFKGGKALDYKPFAYHDAPLLEPKLEDPTRDAESFSFTDICSVIAAREQEATIRRALLAKYTPASYPLGGETYGKLLREQIEARLGGLTGLGSYTGVLSLDMLLDEKGNWQLPPGQPEETNLTAARQLLSIMRQLPHWQPAQIDGQPVVSEAKVIFQALGSGYSIQMRPSSLPRLPAPVK